MSQSLYCREIIHGPAFNCDPWLCFEIRHHNSARGSPSMLATLAHRFNNGDRPIWFLVVSSGVILTLDASCALCRPRVGDRLSVGLFGRSDFQRCCASLAHRLYKNVVLRACNIVPVTGNLQQFDCILRQNLTHYSETTRGPILMSFGYVVDVVKSC